MLFEVTGHVVVNFDVNLSSRTDLTLDNVVDLQRNETIEDVQR